MTKSNPSASSRLSFWSGPLLLLVLLAVLFYRSFDPDLVHFSNDGPLGQQMAKWLEVPSAIFGTWNDLNDAGFACGGLTPSISTMIKWVLGPVGFAKFYAFVALFILGLAMWCFFRALKLSPLAVWLGMLGTVLNSMFFAGACWGVASAQIAIAMDFFALALVCSNNAQPPPLTRWLRYALAGFCVGMNVMEGADIGALCSVLVAVFTLFKTLLETEGSEFQKIARGVGRVLVIAVCAGFLAIQTVVSLVGINIVTAAGTAQDSETKAQHWDWATQWSMPKRETLALVVPGLFGYKMDTPKDMIPAVKGFYENGNYWGGTGRDPVIDRWLDNGAVGDPPPSNFMRFSGGGSYVGILVILLAAWAFVLALRKDKSPFTREQRYIIFFWSIVLVLSLVVAWGRFGPLYALLYKLPYFSTIRNPCKFLIFFTWGLVILFAYGVHALSAQRMTVAGGSPADPVSQLQKWWSKMDGGERKWAYFLLGSVAASLLGWLIFANSKAGFISYLQLVGFGGDSAAPLADYAIAQAGWFVPLIAVAVLLICLAMAGYFSGPKARLGAILLTAFLVFDLVRSDLPYVIHWDFKKKYEIGTLNPVVSILTKNPWENRVAGLPFRAPQGFELLDQMYRIEWMQHHFLYYNIQCLDIIQMPRMAADLKAYLEAFMPHSDSEAGLIIRRWELSNTRYILGPAGYLEVLNQQLDGGRNRFAYAARFEIVPRPGILQPRQLEDLTAVLKDDGRFALFEFKGALPRAKLYSNWLVSTNDTANLKTLASPQFDPSNMVVISTPQSSLAASSTNGTDAGTVEYRNYSTKHIAFDVDAKTTDVLLVNDKYDADWKVTIDGKPASVLRCNYLMRGVQVPPGKHQVEFTYSIDSKLLYVTLAAFGVAVLLGIGLILTRRTPDQR